MKITIKNRRTYRGPGEWICRGRSVLGNPFVMKKESDRAGVIEKYMEWILDNIRADNEKIHAELDRLYAIAQKQELILICWCAPKPCHGDVIKDFVLHRNSEEKHGH